MLMPRLVTALVLIALPQLASADTPVIADDALTAACDAAKALDECPACTCQLTTQSIPIGKTIAGDATLDSIPIGAVMTVSGTKPNLEEYSAAHAVLGTSAKLEHVGRLAQTAESGPVMVAKYTVEGQPQGQQYCAGGCPHEAVGLVHPFIVTTIETQFDMESEKDTELEESRLVLCFEGLGGLTCASLPIAYESRLTGPGKTPEARRKVLDRAGYERSWKLGKAGDVVLGKASGKKQGTLAHPEAHSLSLVDLFSDSDTRPLAR